MSNQDVLYTVAETAKLLRTNPAKVYELVNAGVLPALKLGCMKIRRKSLDEFLEKYNNKDLSNLNDIKDLVEI